MSQSPSPLPLSGGRGFYKEGEGNRTQRSRIRQVMVWCAASWLHVIPFHVIQNLHHPGSTVTGQQISWDWNSQRSESVSFEVVPRILIQSCHSPTSYMLVRVSTYRNNVKRMVVGWVTISHHYNFPLLT